MLLGFSEDYNEIVVNAKHELILRRANTDNNDIIQLKQRNLRFLSSKWNGYSLMSASPFVSRYRSLISSKQTRP